MASRFQLLPKRWSRFPDVITILATAAALGISADRASAGPNAGGTLIPHASPDGRGDEPEGGDSRDGGFFSTATARPNQIPKAGGSWSFLLTRVDPTRLSFRLVVNGGTWGTGVVDKMDNDAAIVSITYDPIPQEATVSLEVQTGGSTPRQYALETMAETRPANPTNAISLTTVPGVFDIPPRDPMRPASNLPGPPPSESTCKSQDLLRLLRLMGGSEIRKMHSFAADGDSVWYSPKSGRYIPVPPSSRHWYVVKVNGVAPIALAQILEACPAITRAGAFSQIRLL